MPPFVPRERRLMGPGPSEVHWSVRKAMDNPAIGYLDSIFVEMMEQLKEMLRYAFQTSNKCTFPVSGPGMMAMETCFVNMVEPGDKVVVCVNGAFGKRMADIVGRCRGVPILVENNWGEPVDPQRLEDALNANSGVRLAAFVHAETSTGVQSNAKTLVEVAHLHDALTIMDTVTSLAGTPVLVDEWGADIVYTGGQKCLSSVAGLSPITFSDRAVETVRKRKCQVQSWLMDLMLLLGYWSGEASRTYHHTAPTFSLYALFQALRLICEEGLEARWERHQRNYTLLKAGLEALGLEFLVEEPCRLPQMNAVLIPEAVRPREAEIRSRLLNTYNLEIGAGLGPLAGKIWRIGLMGESSNANNVEACLYALGEVLK